MVRFLLLFIITASFCAGCGLREREEALQTREVALAQREQQLLVRENALAQREAALTQLELKMDSARVDTTFHHNQQLVGYWNVKMTCTETSCNGSAIGDTRTETWEFSYRNNGVVAKAMTGGELIRTYTGSMEGNRIALNENITSSAAATTTHMLVRLTWGDGQTMEGEREIIRENDCRILYRLQLTKQTLP